MTSPNRRRHGTESRFEEALLHGGTRRLIVTPELAQPSHTATPIAMQSQRNRAPRMSFSWSMDMIPWVNEKPRQRGIVRSNEERGGSTTSIFEYQHRISLSPDAKPSTGEDSLPGRHFPNFRPYVSPELTADSENSLSDDAIVTQLPASLGLNQGAEDGPMDASYLPLDSFSPSSMGLDSKGSSTGSESPWMRPAARLSFSPEDLPMLSNPVRSTSRTEFRRLNFEKEPIESLPEEVPPARTTGQATAEELADMCWKQDASSLDVKQMAMQLGGDDPVAIQARRIFMGRFDLHHHSPLEALRLLSSRLYLNAETSRIDNLLQALGAQYMKENPNTIFQNEENIVIVLFALLLLNTDLHIADLDTKMSQVHFVQNVCQNLKPESMQMDKEIVCALQQMYDSIHSDMLDVPSSISQATRAAPNRSSLQRTRSLGREDGSLSIFLQDIDRKLRRHGSLLRIPLKYQHRNSVPAGTSSSIHGGKKLGAYVQYRSVKDLESVRRLRKPQNLYLATLENECIFLYRELPIKEMGNSLYKLLLVHSLTKSHIDSDQSYVSVTLNDGTIHILFMNASQVNTWMSACNQAAAKFTRVPMLEGASNCDYGWLQVRQKQHTPNNPTTPIPTTAQKNWWSRWPWERHSSLTEDDKLQVWYPPPMSLEPLSSPGEGVTDKLTQYIEYLQHEIQAHETLRDPMIQMWQGKQRALEKATANWERRHAFLTSQLEKFETYMKSLSKQVRS